MTTRATLLAVVLTSLPATATTYAVGAGKTYTQLGQVNALNLMPGDVIEVDGDATYSAVQWTKSGSMASPITLRGLRVNGMRPRLSGGNNTIEIMADNVVVEGFEITGGTSRCVFQHGHRNTLRDSVVHGCPKQGVLGADQDSGDFLMEYVEVYASGGGTQDHQIYMATDEVAHPGAVFRMQYCYVHDANGGNSVKSRAERNEIYYNWIEGALYHELELIGPDPNGAQTGWSIDLKREDSDVVGNVLRKVGASFVARIGGDATGWSKGRYRFVNNTIVLSATSGTVFRLFDTLESVEMHNNVLVRASGTTAINVVRADPAEMMWASGRRISGTNNWVQTGATNTPVEWTGTVTGAAPGFVNAGANDFRPAVGSPLLNAGGPASVGPTGSPFVNPLAAPAFHPPQRALLAVGAAQARPVSGVIEIGAFEDGAVAPGGGAGGGSATGGGSAGGGTAAAGGGTAATGGGTAATGGGTAATGGGTAAAGGGTAAAGGGTAATGGGDATGGGGEMSAGGCHCSSLLDLPLVLAALLWLRRRRYAH